MTSNMMDPVTSHWAAIKPVELQIDSKPPGFRFNSLPASTTRTSYDSFVVIYDLVSLQEAAFVTTSLTCKKKTTSNPTQGIVIS
jgi:hypothetical protein